MQFLANENFPRKSVVYLRAGYDVAYGSEDAPRAELRAYVLAQFWFNEQTGEIFILPR